jgi:hypothetical protein
MKGASGSVRRCVNGRPSHNPKEFILSSRIDIADLRSAITKMDSQRLLSPMGTLPPETFIAKESLAGARALSARIPLRISNTQLTDAAFASLWKLGFPLVVTGLNDRIQLPWSPQYLSEKFGDDKCNLESCENPKVTDRVTLRQFFDKYANGSDVIWKLKVIQYSDDSQRRV